MLKKNKKKLELFLEEIKEKQIDRKMFSQKEFGMLWNWKDPTSQDWFEKERYRYLIPVINLTTKKTYRSVSEAAREEIMWDESIIKSCISGKKLYDDSRYAYLDYAGQPILNEGHSKNHYHPHKPSKINFIWYLYWKRETTREQNYKLIFLNQRINHDFSLEKRIIDQTKLMISNSYKITNSMVKYLKSFF